MDQESGKQRELNEDGPMATGLQRKAVISVLSVASSVRCDGAIVAELGPGCERSD